MTTAIACTSILAALLFALGANVSRVRAGRGKHGGTQTPSDPADALFKAVRAHGNASEYVPTLAILILVVAWRQPGAWTSLLAIAATSSRVLHAAACSPRQRSPSHRSSGSSERPVPTSAGSPSPSRQ